MRFPARSVSGTAIIGVELRSAFKAVCLGVCCSESRHSVIERGIPFIISPLFPFPIISGPTWLRQVNPGWGRGAGGRAAHDPSRRGTLPPRCLITMEMSGGRGGEQGGGWHAVGGAPPPWEHCVARPPRRSVATRGSDQSPHAYAMSLQRTQRSRPDKMPEDQSLTIFTISPLRPASNDHRSSSSQFNSLPACLQHLARAALYAGPLRSMT